MNIETMTLEEVQARSAEVSERLSAISEESATCADVERLEELSTETTALCEERDALTAREAAINEAAEKRDAQIADVINHGTESRHVNMEDNTMEVRNTKEYINAYAEYIKKGDDTECRALLSTNAATGGTVAVPELVEEIVRTAWERDGIIAKVRKTYLQGNVKVGFEASADGAQIHAESADTPATEQSLVLGTVEIKPQSIKKWISISDEVYDLRGEAFLRYIYDELVYHIAKKAADTLVGTIAGLPQTSSASAPAAAKLSAAPAVGTIAQAIALLSDEAANPVVIMNKATWGAFKSAAYAAQYGVDPFEGCEVLFNNTLPAYSAASAGAVYAIVGDLEVGALANFPNGEDIDLKFDDLSQAEYDLIRIIGRQFVGLGAVAPNAFTLIAKG